MRAFGFNIIAFIRYMDTYIITKTENPFPLSRTPAISCYRRIELSNGLGVGRVGIGTAAADPFLVIIQRLAIKRNKPRGSLMPRSQ